MSASPEERMRQFGGHTEQFGPKTKPNGEANGHDHPRDEADELSFDAMSLLTERLEPHDE